MTTTLDPRAVRQLDPHAQPSNGPGSTTDRPGYTPSLSMLGILEMGRRQAWQDVRSATPLILADAVCVVIALAVSTTLAQWTNAETSTFFAVSVIGLTLWMQHLNGLYPACGQSYSTEFRGILRTCMLVSVVVGFALMTKHDWAIGPLMTWGAFSISLFFSLASLRPVVRRVLGRFDWWTQPVVILGNGAESRQMLMRLNASRQHGLRAAGIVFDPNRYWHVGGSGTDGTQAAIEVGHEGNGFVPSPHFDSATSVMAKLEPQAPVRTTAGSLKRSASNWLGPLSELESIMSRAGSSRLAIADPGSDRWYDFHAFQGIPHVIMPLASEGHPTETARLCQVDNSIELHCRTVLTHPHMLLTKRVMDLTLVILTLPLWFPLMLAIAAAIKIFDPGPVFYYQHRVGRYSHPFRAIKFRSMVCEADQKLQAYLRENPAAQQEWKATHKLKNDPRVTKLGCFLRKTSLDEIPQLLNVLFGEMSLVGPRPIIDGKDYDQEYIQEHPEVFALYQMVRPGITGLWQVSGRNETSYKQRVFLDRFYLHNWSIEMDLFILWRTIKTALFREGAC
ncbi:sugar transferase [Roseiconus lacunae]|uniref:Sugar transferase n=1 Tax=Roseiconus lacunae TaxID=2605694 RepID=A0ABT7PR31_9BACT|nr:sugar transferase [Roseiconus lacunae]MDM4018947.1 sugar transferase [Roseiconus lacunae]